MPVASVINDGERQTVVLPPEVRLEGSEVMVKQDGTSLILTPTDDAWARFRSSIGAVSEDFMVERLQPEQQTRGEIFE